MSDISNKMKQTLPQVGLLLGFWLLGELVVYLTHWMIPGSIIGMILLTLSLEFKIIKLSQIQDLSDFIIRNMAFFFVPPAVGLMVNFDIIVDQWLAIMLATILSTVLVLIVTGAVSLLGSKKKKEGLND